MYIEKQCYDIVKRNKRKTLKTIILRGEIKINAEQNAGKRETVSVRAYER